MGFRTGLIALFLVMVASASHARPILEHASPLPGSAVHQAPSQVVLFFSRALLPSATDAVVRNAGGGVVSSGKARVIGKDAQIKVPVERLSPGKYRVEWYATSPDMQHAQGSYNFVVGAKEERKHGGKRVRRRRH